MALSLSHHWSGIAGRVAVECDGLPLGDDQVGRVLQDDRGRVRLRMRAVGRVVGQQVRVAEVVWKRENIRVYNAFHPMFFLPPGNSFYQKLKPISTRATSQVHFTEDRFSQINPKQQQ